MGIIVPITSDKALALTEEVDISFYGTVYNSVKYIRTSLASIAETALELRKYGITSEVVIVDNYSSDGTWEALNELRRIYSEKGLEIRLLRYRCSRGLGREIALRAARGKYLFFIDLDVEYNVNNLVKIIVNYMRIINYMKRGMCFYIFLTPRPLVFGVGGIRDLNRTEDIELCARLAKHSIVLPVLAEDLRPLPESTFMRGLEAYEAKSLFPISTYLSERRYAKRFRDYIRRELRNKLDMIRGMGYTWEKLLKESIYLHHTFSLKNLPKILLWLIYHGAFYILAKMLQREIYNYCDFINNGSLCDVAMFLNYIALKSQYIRKGLGSMIELKQWIGEVLGNEKMLRVVAYFLRFKPSVLNRAFKGEYFVLDTRSW
jgi:glycosyltransferase involved in cell wall biosynthesis